MTLINGTVIAVITMAINLLILRENKLQIATLGSYETGYLFSSILDNLSTVLFRQTEWQMEHSRTKQICLHAKDCLRRHVFLLTCLCSPQNSHMNQKTCWKSSDDIFGAILYFYT
jgi:hypothetical protein